MGRQETEMGGQETEMARHRQETEMARQETEMARQETAAAGSRGWADGRCTAHGWLGLAELSWPLSRRVAADRRPRVSG